MRTLPCSTWFTLTVSRSHEPIQHTADAGISAVAPTLEDLFEECALGMFELMYDFEGATAEVTLQVTADGATREELLVNWLSELLYISERDDLAFCEFEMINLSEDRLEGTARGLPMVEVELKGTPIKAVTYHQLRISHDRDWEATVILDV